MASKPIAIAYNFGTSTSIDALKWSLAMSWLAVDLYTVVPLVQHAEHLMSMGTSQMYTVPIVKL